MPTAPVKEVGARQGQFTQKGIAMAAGTQKITKESIAGLEKELLHRFNVTKDQLDRAPKYANDNDWSWSRENDQRVHDYYKASPYW